MRKQNPKRGRIFLLILLMAGFFASYGGVLFADEDAGVSGCNAIAVDPEASLETQQAICNNAEQFPSSSCAAGGNGTCSSPKTNGTLMDGKHCICISEAEGEVAAS